MSLTPLLIPINTAPKKRRRAKDSSGSGDDSSSDGDYDEEEEGAAGGGGSNDGATGFTTRRGTRFGHGAQDAEVRGDGELSHSTMTNLITWP